MTFAAIADTALTQTTTYQYTARLTANNGTTGTSNTISAQTLAPTSRRAEQHIQRAPPLHLDRPMFGLRWTAIRWHDGMDPDKSLQSVCRFLFPFRGYGVTTRILFTLSVIGVLSRNTVITQYNSTGWQGLASSTTTRINDAWGVVNPVTGKVEVYCTASSFFDISAEKKIIKIVNHIRVDTIRWNGRLVTGVWTNASYPLYTSGDGVFENSRGSWNEVPTGIYE